MTQYIEVTIRYDKLSENGDVRRVSEHYLAEAMSLTEAEAVVTEKIRPYIRGEFVATVAKRSGIAEVMGCDYASWYLGKVAFVGIDERTGKEKRTVSQVLVGAECFGQAYDSLVEHFRFTVADWELVSLSETRIADVFKGE